MILFLQNVKNGGIILNSKTNAVSAFEVLFCASVVDFYERGAKMKLISFREKLQKELKIKHLQKNMRV